MKKPNNFFAPLVIAGITVGFLASAYKYIFRQQPNEDRSSLSAFDSDPQQAMIVADERMPPSTDNEK